MIVTHVTMAAHVKQSVLLMIMTTLTCSSCYKIKGLEEDVSVTLNFIIQEQLLLLS